MKTINSISGGQTSAYIEANYPADYTLFALVRSEDQRLRFKDEKIRLTVEDRIQAPFVGTLEDDLIIYTMLDLEQYLGRKITWVTGITFDEVVRSKGGWLPNMLQMNVSNPDAQGKLVQGKKYYIDFTEAPE